ncbi:MAG TPA: PadR family transcriptional regulator [Mycobacterium sp.]|nr:PadR family transcriptional regulator [Mycobacterium sp.]
MHAARLSTPDYVVLGMVGLGARSGYEIKRTVELSIRYFWTISPAQVYPSLAKLERDGLLTGRDEPQGNRRRRTYEHTAAGSEALRTWLRNQEPMPFELRDIAMVKMFFADALTPADAQELLTNAKARSEELAATLEAIRPEADVEAQEGNPHPLLTLELGIAVHKAMIDVLDRFARAGHRR